VFRTKTREGRSNGGSNLLSGTSGSVFMRPSLPLRRLSLGDLKGIVLTLWVRRLSWRLASSIALGQPRRSPSRNRTIHDPACRKRKREPAVFARTLTLKIRDLRMQTADSDRAAKSKMHLAQGVADDVHATRSHDDIRNRTRYFRALSRAGAREGRRALHKHGVLDKRPLGTASGNSGRGSDERTVKTAGRSSGNSPRRGSDIIADTMMRKNRSSTRCNFFNSFQLD